MTVMQRVRAQGGPSVESLPVPTLAADSNRRGMLYAAEDTARNACAEGGRHAH